MSTISEKLSVVFGYSSCEELEDIEEEGLKKYLKLNNALNIASIFLSPLVGIVRIIAACVMYFFSSREENSSRSADFRKLLLLEIARGGLEILCLGPIFGIGDAVMTLKNHEMLCFKKT